jgi:hypothetical protein
MTDRNARSDIPVCAVQALMAALVLAVGSSLGGNLLFLLGLPLTIIGFILACRAASTWSSPVRTSAFSGIATWLAAMATLGIVGPTTGGLLWYEVAKRAFAASGTVLVGMLAGDDEIWWRRATLIAVSLGVTLFAIGAIGAPNPTIDVFTWTQTCVRALLHRINPYTVIAPDVYRGRHDPGYTVSVYPYMPATLLIYAPWVSLFGDFRFALGASLILAIGLLLDIGRRLNVDPRLTYAAMLAIALHPSSSRMIESGWTEPLLVAAAALFVHFAIRNPDGIGQASSFLFLPALKQYVVAPVVLYVIRARQRMRLRTLVAASSLSTATVLPFLIWNRGATLSGMVFQMASPTVPRLESTSLIALIATTTGAYPGRWTSAVVQLIVGAIAWWRLKDRGLSGLLLASALSLYATFLVGWQAFVNYYYFVGALLVLAALTRAGENATATSDIRGQLTRQKKHGSKGTVAPMSI